MLLCFELKDADKAGIDFIGQVWDRIRLYPGVWEERLFYKSLSGTVYALKLVPTYPHFYLYGYVWVVLCLTFGWAEWLQAIGWTIGILGTVAFSPLPYYVALRLGLKRAGSKARVKLLTSKTLLERLVWHK